MDEQRQQQNKDTAPDSLSDIFKHQFERLKDSDTVENAREWLGENQARVEVLFEHSSIRDFIFEPVKDVFHLPGKGEARRARTIITQVAVVNAIIAGLPGSLGVGVYISISLELWMALALSRAVGLNMSRDEVIDTLIAWVLGVGSILFLFKEGLNLVFPVITAIMPFAGPGTALTQLVVTNFFGVILWILFDELKHKRRFRFPVAALKRLTEESLGLLRHQWNAGVAAAKPAKWREMGSRLYSWLKGDIPSDMPRLRGELFPTIAMASLLSRNFDQLSGPLGQHFIGAIKDRYPDLQDSSSDEIADFFNSEYSDPEEIAGVINLIKGKLFERLVAEYENNDSDQWTAVLHDDENYPGSDLILSDDKGEEIEVSLKASDSISYLEDSLMKYPDFPIIATDEVAEQMAGNHLIWTAGISNAELTSVTQDNYDRLVNDLTIADAGEVALGGVSAQAFVMLWPFVMAYARETIDRDQLTNACTIILPDRGKALASRLVYVVAFGPVFAWWLLARGVLKVTADLDSETLDNTPRRLKMLSLQVATC